MSQEPPPERDAVGPEGPPVQGPAPDVEIDRLLDAGDLPGRPTTAPEAEEAEGDGEPPGRPPSHDRGGSTPDGGS